MRDLLRFLTRLAATPKSIGAVAPSSRHLARALAAQADPARNGFVLELGPGTGIVTQALMARGFAPERIVAIEHDEHFATLVRARCPGVRVIRGNAFDFPTLLREHFAAIVSGLPLLNFPPEQRRGLIADALAHLAPGAPFVQFSYGLTPPIAAPSGACVALAARVWRNLPPAKVWVYRRTG